MTTLEPGGPDHPRRVGANPMMWVVLERDLDERGLEGARPIVVFTEVVEALRFVAASDRSMFVVSVPHGDAVYRP